MFSTKPGLVATLSYCLCRYDQIFDLQSLCSHKNELKIKLIIPEFKLKILTILIVKIV